VTHFLASSQPLLKRFRVIVDTAYSRTHFWCAGFVYFVGAVGPRDLVGIQCWLVECTRKICSFCHYFNVSVIFFIDSLFFVAVYHVIVGSVF
jgi:hypothetical protein